MPGRFPSRRAACACGEGRQSGRDRACRRAARAFPWRNDLLIEMKAAAVNPSDVKAATGLMPYAVFPRTSGRDYAGVVVDGPDGWIGREVFGSSGDLGIRRDGTHATHLVVERGAAVDKPSAISWEEAAGIGVPFVTAMEGLRRAGLPKPPAKPCWSWASTARSARRWCRSRPGTARARSAWREETTRYRRPRQFAG